MKILTTVAQILTAGMLMAVAGSAASQQAYPIKPIRFIVPFPPGGSNDISARIVGQKLAESFGVQTLVENRGGASTIIGSEALLKSAPDGYTFMVTSSTHITTSLLLPAPYNAVRDFAAVATIGSSDQALVLHPSVPANNLQEFIALAKSRPEQLNYASSGTGGTQHLAGEFFNTVAGVKMQHVPYKGGAQAVNDLMSGQVQLVFANPSNVVSYIKTGRLKAIAIGGVTRLPALPQVPTFAEAGLPGYGMNTWQGILAPASTPKAVIDKLSTEIARILAMPDIKEKLRSQGIEPFISTPEQFAALMKADHAKYEKIIKTANIKLR